MWTEGDARCGSMEIDGAAEVDWEMDPGCLIHAGPLMVTSRNWQKKGRGRACGGGESTFKLFRVCIEEMSVFLVM